MRRISTDLPLRYRLTIQVAKRRGGARDEAFFPSIGKVARMRSGNKVSRFFRHIFEHKHINRILGSQIALFVVATSFVPVSASNTFEQAEQVVISTNNVSIKTVASHAHIPRTDDAP